MSRVRIYRSYLEALSEWRRMAVPEGALGRMDLATKQFFFMDGIGKEEAIPMIEAVKARGGRGFHCRGDRMLVALSPIALEAMMNGGEAPQLTDSLSKALKYRFDDEAPLFEWSGGSLDLSHPRIMGILNVTPDSFSDGGRHLDVGSALRRAFEMKEEGASLIDIGGESTRPGSISVSADEEWGRIGEVVRRVSEEVGLPVSVDTRRPEVARKALKAGACIVNDVSGLGTDMAEAVSQAGAGAIVMHMRGEPSSMQSDTRYDDVVGDTYHYLERRVEGAIGTGVRRESIVIDPGLGFGKDLDGNLQIMSRLEEYRSMGRPILLAASRKSFLGKVAGGDADDRLEAGLAAASIACWQGVRLFRVHDVRATVRAVTAAHAMTCGQPR